MGSNKSFRCEEQLSGSRVPEGEENLVHPEPLPLARMQVHTHLGENPGAHLFGTLGTSHRMVGLQGSVSGWGRGAIVLPSPWGGGDEQDSLGQWWVAFPVVSLGGCVLVQFDLTFVTMGHWKQFCFPPYVIYSFKN